MRVKKSVAPRKSVGGSTGGGFAIEDHLLNRIVPEKSPRGSHYKAELCSVRL